MKKIGPRTLARYRGLVLNIHPALLPKFGGQGMYGRRVHEEVLAAGDRVTGVTVHLADEEYDRGPILAQREVPVVRGDTVDSLAARVLEAEHALYVETLARIAQCSTSRLPMAWRRSSTRRQLIRASRALRTLCSRS